jgi:hypothetical protein
MVMASREFRRIGDASSEAQRPPMVAETRLRWERGRRRSSGGCLMKTAAGAKPRATARQPAE